MILKINVNNNYFKNIKNETYNNNTHCHFFYLWC